MQLETTIFCEDIRDELNNKKSLMGIYNNSIIIRVTNPKGVQFPIPSRLCCFCRFKNEENDPTVDNFEFYYLLPGQEPLKVLGGIKIEPGHRYFMLHITGYGIPIQPGNVGIKIILKNKDQSVREFLQEDALKIEISSVVESKPSVSI